MTDEEVMIRNVADITAGFIAKYTDRLTEEERKEFRSKLDRVMEVTRKKLEDMLDHPGHYITVTVEIV